VGSELEKGGEKQPHVPTTEAAVDVATSLEEPKETPEEDWIDWRDEEGDWVKGPQNPSLQELRDLQEKSLDAQVIRSFEMFGPGTRNLPYIVGMDPMANIADKAPKAPVKQVLFVPGYSSSTIPGRRFYDPVRDAFVTVPAPRPAPQAALLPRPAPLPAPLPASLPVPLPEAVPELPPGSPLSEPPEDLLSDAPNPTPTPRNKTRWSKEEEELLTKSVRRGITYVKMVSLFTGRTEMALRTKRIDMIRKGAAMTQTETERRDLRLKNARLRKPAPRILTLRGSGGTSKKTKMAPEVQWTAEQDEKLLRIWYGNDHDKWVTIAQNDDDIPTKDRAVIIGRRHHLSKTQDPSFTKVMTEYHDALKENKTFKG
jgi:hypothetical protein